MSAPGYINSRNSKLRGRLRLFVSMPFIYSMIIPIALLHLWTQLYQQVCFRLYGIERVDQRKYIRDQRWKLKYLTWSERINCWYCGYANGTVAFVREVAKRTEQMWCPIRNNVKLQQELQHRRKFAEYGNENALKEETQCDF